MLEPSGGFDGERDILPGTAHLDVRFSALQGVTLHDLQHDYREWSAAPRLQESTWTFEGCPRAGDEEGRDWQVVDITWRVWEVQEAAEAARRR